MLNDDRAKAWHLFLSSYPGKPRYDSAYYFSLYEHVDFGEVPLWSPFAGRRSASRISAQKAYMCHYSGDHSKRLVW